LPSKSADKKTFRGSNVLDGSIGRSFGPSEHDCRFEFGPGDLFPRD
jgi:hypothetical protein